MMQGSCQLRPKELHFVELEPMNDAVERRFVSPQCQLSVYLAVMAAAELTAVCTANPNRHHQLPAMDAVQPAHRA